MLLNRVIASSSSRTMGSPPGLALVMTKVSRWDTVNHAVPAGRPAASWKSRNWIGVQGSMAPSSRKPGAMPGNAASQPSRLASSTTGRSRDSSSVRSASFMSACGATDAAFANITAKGFSSRFLRSRRRATAAAFVASQAR